MPLPGMPGSDEFNAAYAGALAGNTISSFGAGRIKAGSLDALVLAWLASPKFLGLKPQRQQACRRILEKWTKEHGDKPVALLTRQHINAMLAKKAGTPAAANHWLRLVKVLMSFAVKEGFRKENPAADIERFKLDSAGFHSWTEDEIARFENRHPVGSKARLALALGLYTAQRRSDVVRMGRQHISNGLLAVTQQKTGTKLVIPVLPELAECIEQTPGGNLNFLVTEYGGAFTTAGFGAWFRKRCDEGGPVAALHVPRAAQGGLYASGRGQCRCQRHRRHQRAHVVEGGRALYPGRRSETPRRHRHEADENKQ